MKSKAIARIVGLLSILGAVLAVPANSETGPLGAIRVRLVAGDVQVKIAETGEWAPVAVNTPLLEGDELWVPDGSRTALQTNDGTDVRLDGNTALEVLRMDQAAFQFHLTQGRVYVRRTARRGVLQFDTPDASVRAFGRSTFGIDVPDGETDVSAFSGSVAAESDAGTTTVHAGHMLVLAPDGYAELSPLPPPDEWANWNADRDRIARARRGSTGHLPDELRVYSDDFDENGRWVYVEDYGYCWTPTVLVISDWAPYRHGRWCWRGGDYVWVGYEPWGWAPYHYGRWAFVARVGWCWVPPERGNVYWGPGYVGWVHTPDHVAWVPLAPRETYYGHGNYGRYSVNVTNVNVTNVHVTNVYRNVNVTNSVTVVNNTTFVTGRPGPVNRNAVAEARDDFARRRNIVVGRPPIKPTGTSYAPVVRSIPEAKRPPATVRRIDMRELRQSRPLVRESGRSAIRPAATPRTLEVRKVEKPLSVNERIRERRESQKASPPVERRRIEQAPPPVGREERRVRPTEPAPPAKEKPKQAPPEERRRIEQGPPPVERGGGRGRPQEAPSVERTRPEARPTPTGGPVPRESTEGRASREPGSRERRAQDAQERPAGPVGREERRVRPTEPAPPAKEKPQQAPPEERRRIEQALPPVERGGGRGRPQETPSVERTRPEARPTPTDGPASREPGRRERGAQDAQKRPAPGTGGERGLRGAAPIVKTAPATPPQPKRGVERDRRLEPPAERVRPERGEDNTERPAPAPERRNERGRR